MMKSFLSRSKKGITLVESVLAVVLLGFAATGILTMLTVSGTKIFQLSDTSATYAEATQRLDLVIATISNSGFEGSAYTDAHGNAKTFLSSSGELNPDNVLEALEFDSDCDLVIVGDPVKYPGNPSSEPTKNIRGWYLKLTYNNVSVQGFASFTEGSFDKA